MATLRTIDRNAAMSIQLGNDSPLRSRQFDARGIIVRG
jgi:hypothetical protein